MRRPELEEALAYVKRLNVSTEAAGKIYLVTREFDAQEEAIRFASEFQKNASEEMALLREQLAIHVQSIRKRDDDYRRVACELAELRLCHAATREDLKRAESRNKEPQSEKERPKHFRNVRTILKATLTALDELE